MAVAVLGLLGILPVIPKEWLPALLFYLNYSRLGATAGRWAGWKCFHGKWGRCLLARP
jgi:hypothetical protein